MLKVRVAPVLLLKEGRMIKTKQFSGGRDTGDPLTTVRVYDAQGADELLLLDISASVQGRDQWFDLISKSAGECFVPITVGGGIRTVQDARAAFVSGADRVSVSSAAIERPDFVDELASIFGRANIVVCVDVKNDEQGVPRVSSRSGTRMWDRDPVEWSVEAAFRGAGEILMHFVDRDGMMNGYDLEMGARGKCRIARSDDAVRRRGKFAGCRGRRVAGRGLGRGCRKHISLHGSESHQDAQLHA